MKHSLLLALIAVALTGCVDSTGISADSTKSVHPSTSENAVVTVVEYGDFQCPACKAAFEILIKPVLEKYGTDIRFEFAHFPLTSIHRYAMEAAEASECAADQSKFWEFVDLVYTEQDKLSSEQIDVWAEELGLEMEVFGRCTASHIKRDTVMADYERGKTLGVSGTPTFFVNGQKVPSTLEDLSAAIDAALGSSATRL